MRNSVTDVPFAGRIASAKHGPVSLNKKKTPPKRGPGEHRFADQKPVMRTPFDSTPPTSAVYSTSPAGTVTRNAARP